MEYLEVVGWDNGFDYEKFAVDGEQAKFPSVRHIPKQTEGILYDNTYEFKKSKMIITYNDTTLFLGDYAIEQAGDGGKRNFTKNKFEDDTEVAKFLAGLTLFSDDRKIDIEKLVLGLSLQTYHKYREDIVDFYKDRVFKFEIGGQERKVSINDVMCVPQGIGSYYNLILNNSGKVKDHGLLEKRYGLVDIGGNTLDGFVGTGLDPVDESQFGAGTGLSDAFKGVSKKVPYTLIQHYYLKGNDTMEYGDVIIESLQERCEEQFKLIAEEIYTQLRDGWNRQMDRIKLIVLTGGGANAIGGPLKKKIINKLGKDVKITDKPQFANVRGYYKLGVTEQNAKKKA